MNLSPLPIQKFFDNNGRPLVGGKLFTYEAGTSVKTATYVDSSGVTPNTNPVILDFRGECRLWIDPQQAYKFVLSPANDPDPPTDPIWSVDNITAAPQAFDNAAVDTGSVNNISLSIPQISSPVAFTRVVFKAANTNTGPTTLQINGGTALPVVTQKGTAFSGGEIQQFGFYEVIFDGGSWQLQSPALMPNQQRTTLEIAAGTTPTNYWKFPSPWKDISRYVSDNTGATDVGTQLNEALKAEKNIVIPEGIYLTSIPLVYRNEMHIVGGGYLNTIIRGSFTGSMFVSPYGETPAIGERPLGVYLENFGMFPATPGSITSGSIGINLRNAQYCMVRDVLMQFFDIGVATNQIAQYLGFDRLIVQVANTGFYGESIGGGNRLIDCDIAGNVVAMDFNGGAWDLFGCTAEALSNSTSYCVRAGRPGGQDTVVHADGLYTEGTSVSTVTLQIENSVTRSRFSLHRHSTLGSIVNNAGTNVMIEVPGQGYYNPLYRSQRIEFASAIDGSPQAVLRTNGTNAFEIRNSTNSGYADTYMRNLMVGGTAAGVSGFVTFGNLTQATVGAAGGASALPATPAGYLRFFINASEFVIPYYLRA